MTRVAGGIEKGMSRKKAGAVALAVLAVLVYFAFTKDIPFTHGHRVDAYFTDVANIQPKSPVRIAGVNVGKVAKVEREPGSSLTKLVLDLNDTALPIHRDATAKVRPRIFLEGNFFVDLRPGSPTAPELKSGGAIPAAQTAGPVQLDQLLSAVNRDSRDGLTSIFTEIGTALDTVGTPAENATQDPDVKGLTGGQSLNRALRYGPDGFRGGARIFDALTGLENGDVEAIFAGFRDFNSAFTRRETQLVSLIRDFATTMGAFADDEDALRRSTREFSRVAIESEPTLRSLKDMLPRLTKFANELAPSLDDLPETMRLADPWIEETTALLSKDELGTTASLSRPTIRGFAKLANESIKTLPEFDRIALCWNRVWYPTLLGKLDDGTHSSGVENYKEFWYSLVGSAGESQNFNANGPYLRAGGGPGSIVTTPGYVPNKAVNSGRKGSAPRPQLGTRPALPTAEPPIRDDLACHRNTPPNLAATAGSSGP
jgi:ABC-type transporter Mla subunit MlaD